MALRSSSRDMALHRYITDSHNVCIKAVVQYYLTCYLHVYNKVVTIVFHQALDIVYLKGTGIVKLVIMAIKIRISL